MKSATPTCTIAAGCVVLAVAGCAVPENDRMTIGQSVKLEAFSPAPAPLPETESPDQVATPSINGISRSHWQMTQILVPVDGGVHRQTYTKRLSGTDSTRRQRRLYPTPTSALELTNGSEEDQEGEAALNVLIALTDYLLIIPRALIDWPATTRISPDEAYQRYWNPERWELEPGSPEPQPPGSASPPDPRRVTP